MKSYKVHIFFSVLFLVVTGLVYYFIFLRISGQHVSEEFCGPEESFMTRIKAHHPAIRYTGRFSMDEEDRVSFAHSGCKIEARFSGTRCFIVLKNYSIDPLTYTSNYFRIRIDSLPEIIMHVTNDSSLYKIRGLEPGLHKIEIFKRTEAACGRCDFLGFYIDKNESLYDLSPRPKRRIEFIGNSITAGYGNEDSIKSHGFDPATENNYMAFSSITARKLDAEFHTICFSGKGVYRNYDHSTNETIPVLYRLTYPLPRKKWNFSSWTPQLVVINLGTNDFATSPPPRTEFVDAYATLLATVKTHYPEASIICLDGPMLIDGWPKDQNGESFNTLSLSREYIKLAISRANKMGFNRIYHFSLSVNGPYGYGANWHPNVKQHQHNAEELSTFIRQLMNW